MTDSPKYMVALFQSVTQVIRAERLLKEAKVPHKIIPVPKEISTDCGVCIRFSADCLENIKKALGESSGLLEIREL